MLVLKMIGVSNAFPMNTLIIGTALRLIITSWNMNNHMPDGEQVKMGREQGIGHFHDKLRRLFHRYQYVWNNVWWNLLVELNRIDSY